MIKIHRFENGSRNGMPFQLEIPMDGTIVPRFVRIEGSWYYLDHFDPYAVPKNWVCQLFAELDDPTILHPEDECIDLPEQSKAEDVDMISQADKDRHDWFDGGLPTA